MQKKKSDSADIEHKRLPLFFLGILCASALVLTAFEWRSYETRVVELDDIPYTYIPEEIIIASIPKKEKELKPPPRPPVDEFILTDEIPDNTDLPLFPEIDPIEPEIFQIGFEEEFAVEDTIYIDVEEYPEFPGGEAALFGFLKQNLNYPARAKEAGIDGKVYLTFVINKVGEITDVEVLSGIGWGCDDEAIRVVNSMPIWSPGKQRGRPVNVRYNLPIKYTLAR